MTKYISLIISLLFLCCTARKPVENFSITNVGAPPNYNEISYWIAHPEKQDNSDVYPKKFIPSSQTIDSVDVFFIYPTIYLKGEQWNADVNNKKLNKKISKSAILHQASVFNGLANIYSPIYRQMHIHGYKDNMNGPKAFDLAYKDIENAFKYYLENNNNGNDIILAAHSQGTNHAEKLLQDYILKTDSLIKKIKLAYLIGMPINEISENFPPCSDSNDVNCFLSWRTFSEGFYPSYKYGDDIIVTNPINWQTDTSRSDFKDHQGILFFNRKMKYDQSVSCRVNQGLLWVSFQNIPMQKLFEKSNYHIADYNLFWNNIRENFMLRMSSK